MILATFKYRNLEPALSTKTKAIMIAHTLGNTFDVDGLEEMNAGLKDFLIHYNLYRRHGSLRRVLKVKTPFQAVEKWYEPEPEIFTNHPMIFKIKY